MQFATLREEMHKRKVTVNAIARALNVHRVTASRKLHGKLPLSFAEACIIQGAFFRDINIKALFKEQA